ncbi:MAG: hypothetical protein M1814_003204 [Vezdaea aestivalis]|nr:MAG: hypothetical protein M1814_003204 [Vezdaea aestivalis]
MPSDVLILISDILPYFSHVSLRLVHPILYRNLPPKYRANSRNPLYTSPFYDFLNKIAFLAEDHEINETQFAALDRFCAVPSTLFIDKARSDKMYRGESHFYCQQCRTIQLVQINRCHRRVDNTIHPGLESKIKRLLRMIPESSEEVWIGEMNARHSQFPLGAPSVSTGQGSFSFSAVCYYCVHSFTLLAEGDEVPEVLIEKEAAEKEPSPSPSAESDMSDIYSETSESTWLDSNIIDVWIDMKKLRSMAEECKDIGDMKLEQLLEDKTTMLACFYVGTEEDYWT